MRPAKAKGEPEIASLVIRGRKALVSLVENLEPVLESKSKVGSHLARFNLWSASFGAHRAAGKRALEYRLRDASSVKNQILSLLRDLSTVIDQAQASARGQSEPSHDDPAYDEIEAYFLAGDSATQSPLDRSFAEIGHIVDCLLRLSATINNPAPHDQFQSRAGAGISEYFEPWDVRHVQEKFKDLDPTIAERLGKAVTMRRHYFRYREEHHHKLSEGLEDDNVDGGDETTVASSIPEHLKDLPDISSSLYLDNQSEFSVTSYAPSSAEPDQLAVPPIPQEHLEGPFLCPFCKMIIQIDTRRDWKKHVFRDLRPYVCIEKTCPTPTRQYARRSEWTHHMKQDHWRTWYCSFGCSGIFPKRETWREHYTSTHSKEVSEQQLKILEAESIHESLDKAVGSCPVCMSANIRDSRHYSSHIGHHLELVALFSLPSIDSKDEIGEDGEVRPETLLEDRAEHHDDASSSAGDSTTSLEAEPARILRSFSPQSMLEKSGDFEAAAARRKEESDKEVTGWVKELKDLSASSSSKPEQTTPSPFSGQGPSFPSPLPEGWIAHLDQNSGQYYYIHLATHATQWEFPKRPNPIHQDVALLSPRQEMEELLEAYSKKERPVDEEREKEEAAAIARAKQAARDQIEAERKGAEEHRTRETLLVPAVVAAARAQLEAAINAREEAEALAKTRMDEKAELRMILENEAKIKAEYEARKKMERERKDA